MTKAKDIRISKQKTMIATQADRIKELEGKVLSESVIGNELQDELKECEGINSRMNATSTKDRKKIDELKEVARFYRAQRDRVDAYLSATIDAADPMVERPFFPDDPHLKGSPDTTPVIPLTHRLRPNINEPETYFSRADGRRDFADYRDAEPGRNWEDF